MTFTSELYSKALIEPARKGANSLQIISGYATSAMAFHHLDNLEKENLNVSLKILIGMCSVDGLALGNHRGFQKLTKDYGKSKFCCNYIYRGAPVHSKVYIWLRDGQFDCAFVGSANYTQTAFSSAQRELLGLIEDKSLIGYLQNIERDSIYCDNPDAEDLIAIYNDKNFYSRHRASSEITPDTANLIPNRNELQHVTVSLLARNGEIHTKAGLNWGQRKGRDHNQAYIQLPPEVYKSSFFPIRASHFTVLTDDNKAMICTRAQKDSQGQAIETPQNNSLFGEYFRNRLGLANGAFVTKADLLRYGRTDVAFYKIDDENFYMDFSVSKTQFT